MAITIEQVYEQIDDQRTVVISLLNKSARNPIAPTQLSDAFSKLATLNQLLGEFLSDLKRLQLDKEATIYAAALKATSATAAAALARIESRHERLDFEKADTKHSDVWKLVSMGQTHIKAMAAERNI